MATMEKQEFLSLPDDAKFALFKQIQSEVYFLRGLANGLMDKIPNTKPMAITLSQPIPRKNEANISETCANICQKVPINGNASRR